MKDRDSERHPGPMRFMRVDAEFAGIMVAIAFVLLGVVALPLARWFLLGDFHRRTSGVGAATAEKKLDTG